MLKTEAAPDDSAAFEEGLEAAGDGAGLDSRLFTARTRVVAGDASPDSSASYLSGLLIGAEVASVPALLDGEPHGPGALVGDPRLCRWYEIALARAGLEVERFDGDAAALAGLKALMEGHDG